MIPITTARETFTRYHPYRGLSCSHRGLSKFQASLCHHLWHLRALGFDDGQCSITSAEILSAYARDGKLAVNCSPQAPWQERAHHCRQIRYLWRMFQRLPSTHATNHSLARPSASSVVLCANDSASADDPSEPKLRPKGHHVAFVEDKDAKK